MRKVKDWGQCCPDSDCPYHGQFGIGNIKALSTYSTQSGKRRIFECKVCYETFSETRTPYFLTFEPLRKK